MRNQTYVMRDPTAEISPVLRERLAPGKDLSEATIGLLSISKERSDEFLASVAENLSDQGLNVLRFRNRRIRARARSDHPGDGRTL